MRARESRRLASPAPRWLRSGPGKQGGGKPREVGEEAGEGGGGDAGD